MGFFDFYPYTNWHNVNLDWVLERVKEFIEIVKANDQAFKDLKEANEAFKQYVTNYLQDLDVQEEINIKMDSLLESGVLTGYLQPYISTDVTTWLEENITEPEGVVIDSSLTVEGACADSKAVGENLYISKAVVFYGNFNIDTENRKLQLTSNLAIGDTRHRIIYQIQAPLEIDFTDQTAVQGYHHYLLYKISTGRLLFFIPHRNWNKYEEVDAEIRSNTRDYIFILDARCSGVNSNYRSIDGPLDNYTIDNLAFYGSKTSFEYFKTYCRATPYVLNVNFLTISSLYVYSLSIQKINGNGYENYATNYLVDWSNLSNPSYTKLLLINKDTKEIEVHPEFVDSMKNTHLYLGFVYNGAIGDIHFTNSECINGFGQRYRIFSLESDSYRDIFKKGKDLYKLARKVGVIGDSLAVGYMKNSSGTVIQRNINYSWPKRIEKDSNNEWKIFGNSGQNVLTWCTDSTYGKVEMEAAGNKCQMYIIGLGVNDASESDRGIPLGTPNDIVNNPDTVATTYYGGYNRIIRLVKRLNQNAIIICLTNPKAGDRGEAYNAAVRYITNTYYSNDNSIILLDLYSYKPLFTAENSPFLIDSRRPMAGGHFTAYGYRLIADFIENRLDDLMLNNRDTFEPLPFISYDN